MDYSNINLDIIISYLDGTCSADEELRLKEWIEKDPENEEFLLFVKKVWDTSSEKRKFNDVDSAWLRFNEQFDLNNSKSPSSGRSNIVSFGQLKRKSFSSSWASWGLAAAAMAFVIFVSLKVIDISAPAGEIVGAEKVEYRIVETDKGQRTRLRLSDGSTVQLNAESRLLIPETFNENNGRDVILEGEAFFDVTHDPERQFVVTTDRTVTKVLGTKFNINSYDFENQVTVAVAEGSVSMESRSRDSLSRKTIAANQYGIFADDGSTMVTESGDMNEFLGWTNGHLVFKQDSLSTVIQKLERWYGIDIQLNFDAGTRSDKKLTATFTDRQRLDEVLESISLVLDFEFKHNSYLAKKYTFYNNQLER